MIRSIDIEDKKRYFTAKRYNPIKLDMKTCVFFIILAIVTISICSKSSPLYPINDAPDANAYMTMGKSILKGYVPYKDLYDHKGPFLYVIHALGSLVSRTSFIGIYFFEILSCYFLLVYFYKTMRLYLDRKSVAIMPLVAAFVYASPGFINGDSVEEYSLPILMYALYVGVKATRENKLPEKHEFFVIGLSSGCLFWMKFNITAFYLGWIGIFIYIAFKRRMVLILLKSICIVIGGVAVVTLPFVIYFAVNGAVGDWFEVYFYDNIFRYTSSGNSLTGIQKLINGIVSGFFETYIESIPFYFVFFIGVVWFVVSREMKTILIFVLPLVFLHVLSFGIGNVYHYYVLPYYILSVPGWVSTYMLIDAFIHKRSDHLFRTTHIFAIICILSVVFMYCCSSNTHLILMDKCNHPLYRIKKILCEKKSVNDSILNYGWLDLGVYTVMDSFPKCRYYYIPNMVEKLGLKEQNTFIIENRVKYIVSEEEVTIEGYNEVFADNFIVEKWPIGYYLYERQ